MKNKNHSLKKWRRKSHDLGQEMEEYARNYKCKKCSTFYCSHMLKARAQKFKKKIDISISDMIRIKDTSLIETNIN